MLPTFGSGIIATEKKSRMIQQYVRRMLQRLVHRPVKSKALREWSIGIYLGKSPIDFVPPTNVSNPVVTRKHFTNVNADLVADPFMIQRGSLWYMFMEVVNGYTGRGEIGVAESKDGLSWGKCRIVLREPFHLSYPYVFEWNNEFYMLPESRQSNSIRLYKATRFPGKWKLVRELVTNCQYVDPSVFFARGHWWLMTAGGKLSNAADSLFLHYSDDLVGRWIQHPKSPVVVDDPSRARPAGRIREYNGEIFRYAQDCVPDYGLRVRAFRITQLTTTSYAEEEVKESPILYGAKAGWNSDGMHHIDPHVLSDGTFVACVDGWSWRNPQA
jgi:hypothetical protein